MRSIHVQVSICYLCIFFMTANYMLTLLLLTHSDFECVVQSITVQSIACATLVNVGSQLAASNHPGLASVLFGGSSVVGFLIYRGFRRVRRIDKFEKNIRG